MTIRSGSLATSFSVLCLALASCGDDSPDQSATPSQGVQQSAVPGVMDRDATSGPQNGTSQSDALESEPTTRVDEAVTEDIELNSGTDSEATAEADSESAEDTEPAPVELGEPVTHIYLALGQSNMQGAAHLPDEPISHPRVQVLQGQNCNEHDIPYGQWREHFQPIIRCQEGTRQKPDGSTGPIGLSPADTFAVTMADAAPQNVTIGIVGAAYGGTDIEAHLPNCGQFCTPPYGDVNGAPRVNGTTPIYQWILDLARRAQEVGEIKGIIFHHGESNSQDPEWLSQVNTYITSLREDLNLNAADVPFITGELPRTGCCSAHNSLVQQIPGVVENGHWVSSGPMEDGTVLGDRSDSLHWSTDSVLEMGKRYAAKMLEVQQGQQPD